MNIVFRLMISHQTMRIYLRISPQKPFSFLVSFVSTNLFFISNHCFPFNISLYFHCHVIAFHSSADSRGIMVFMPKEPSELERLLKIYKEFKSSGKFLFINLLCLFVFTNFVDYFLFVHSSICARI